MIRTDYYDKTYENFTYNKNGALIEAENQYGKVKNLDIYGRVKTEEALGEKNLIPFRFQGQYEDEETGLKRGRPYSNAVSSKEVLVEGRVPANKLTITCPG